MGAHIKKVTELLQQSVSSLYTKGELKRVASAVAQPDDEINKKVGLFRGALLV